ncbi:MAG: hypothetical protein DMG58_31050 [Acidobacteria bacterium]|nr:MAG: hypothetical protein DMG58_31050 [Acidobacteriota bacterium]
MGIRAFAVFFAACTTILAQTDAQEIVRRSVEHADRSWQARLNYLYTKRTEGKRLDAHGVVKSVDVDVENHLVINGGPVEVTVTHNGGPATAAQQRKNQESLEKRRLETPAGRADRQREEHESHAFIDEVPQAFDFRMIGTDEINGRSAYVVSATPKPGYQAHTKYGKIFAEMRGKLWVDQQDFGWVKADVTVTEPFSMGYFLARVQPGSRILLEQTRVSDGLWMPKKVEVKTEAKVFFLITYKMNEIITYADYRPAQGASVASSAAGVR